MTDLIEKIALAYLFFAPQIFIVLHGFAVVVMGWCGIVVCVWVVLYFIPLVLMAYLTWRYWK